MSTDTVTVGRLVLREDRIVSETEDAGSRTITLTGQESPPRLAASALQQRREDILSSVGSIVPVTFTAKTYLDGFYQIADGTSSVEDWKDGMRVVPWSLTLRSLGTPDDTDLESRLSGAQTRANDFSATGERTHTPSLGALAYYAGTSVTGTVSRPCSDGGNLTTYRGVALAVSPRWVSAPAAYAGGRVRFTDSTGLERAGLSQTVATTGWTLTNGVVRLRPGSSGTFELSAWDGSAWESTEWTVRHQDPWVNVTAWTQLSLTRNDFETVSLRLVQSLSFGRLLVDVILRRGMRFVEIYVQRHAADRIGVVRTTGAAHTQTSGYVVANADDVAGNRSVVASARTFTADAAAGGVTKTATATLDAMVGVVLNGSGAAAGDAAADLYAQYLGAAEERVKGVRR
jgi:hypothetical protein